MIKGAILSKAKSIVLSKYFLAVLISLAAFSTILNRTVQNGFVDRCDGYNYLANGMAFIEMGREFMNPHANTYEDFQKSQTEFKFNDVPYPNKVFSLLATKFTLDSDFIYPSRTTWLAVTSVTLGLLALWLILFQISNVQVATISTYLIFTNNHVIQFFGRPLSDPFAWALIVTSIVVYLSSRTWGRWLAAIVLGTAFAFRLQSFFVLISQCIYEIVSYRRNLQTKKQTLINLSIVVGVSFITFKTIVFLIESTYLTNVVKASGDFNYYKTWASHSLLSLNFSEMIDYFTKNTSMIFFTFAIPIVGSLYLPKECKNDLRIRFLRWFAFSGAILPILFYTIAPGFETRYLIYSVPIMTFLTTLNVFTLLKRYVPKISDLSAKGIFTVILIHMAIIGIGAPTLFNSPEVAQYFDIRLPLVKSATPATNGFILTNKALAGSFFKNFNTIRAPAVDRFLKGDNSNVSAVILFFDMGCSSDQAFNPMDYLRYNRLVDDHHNVFVRDFSYENASREIIVYFNQKFLPENK